MYTLKTTDSLLYFKTYQDLKEELQHIRGTGSSELLWIEANGLRYISEVIKVHGRFIEVFVFQPKPQRKVEVQRDYQADSNLFKDCEGLSQGM